MMVDATREEWQEFFDAEFPDGIRVFRVKDVIENLPYTDALYTRGVKVLGATEAGPEVQFFPLGQMFKDFTYVLSDTETMKPGQFLYRTDDPDEAPFLVMDGVLPPGVVEAVRAERKEGSQS